MVERNGGSVAYRGTLAAALIAALIAVPWSAHAARPPAEPVTYAAPAGSVETGHTRGAVYDAVLPSGRLVTPAGMSVITAMNALGMALTPNGRFAIVSCDDTRQAAVHSTIDPSAAGGFSLVVVDVTTMQVVDRYRAPDAQFWAGVAALPDPALPSRTLVLASGGAANAVYVLRLDAAGHLTPDPRPLIAMPGPTDPAFADEGRSFPGTIVTAADGRHAYVVNELSGTVGTIDTATRKLAGPLQRVGFFPFGAALAGNRLIVSNEGLMRYAKLPQFLTAPPFRGPTADLERASSLSFIPLGVTGVPTASGADAPLPMDATPDGLRIVGGAHPSALVTTPDGAYAYVAMTNVDRIATVALGVTPRVVGGTELRLFDKGPYGTQPAALALSRDGSRLYAALAGLNAVAVIDARDPAHLHRLGLIPTGWYPTALALSADDRTLYALNTKGYGHDPNFTGDPPASDANAVWSTLQKIDLSGVRLGSATLNALANARRVVTVPVRYPRKLTHVVVILEEDKTFDAMLGDLGPPYGDPSLAVFGRAVTPNLHALAQRYGLAANLYADAEESDGGHQFFSGGMTTVYGQRTLFDRIGRTPLNNSSEDPEAYPRSGSIFNALARNNISYRDYGDLVEVSGYHEGLYTLDVPAPAVLEDHIDLNYPGPDPQARDVSRAAEFMRDYGTLVAQRRQPQFTLIWLPGDRGGLGRGIPALPQDVADGDRALGAIVQYLSRLPSWKQTALFVMPVDAQASRDHIDAYRTYAVVAGPYAKRHYVGTQHLSTVSVLKTTEQLLGLAPLALGDLLATDMSDFFTAKGGDAKPYTAIAVPSRPVQ